MLATTLLSENNTAELEKTNSPCKVSFTRNYAYGVRSFPHPELLEKINDSKQGNITTVLDSMIDEDRNYCMREHAIKDLSLEEAYKLRKFYTDCMSVVRDEKSDYYCTDDAHCTHAASAALLKIKPDKCIAAVINILNALYVIHAFKQHVTPKDVYLDLTAGLANQKEPVINRMKEAARIS
jgi:hypothetical protein